MAEAKPEDTERALRTLGWFKNESAAPQILPSWKHEDVVWSQKLPDPNDPLIRAQATDWLLERGYLVTMHRATVPTTSGLAVMHAVALAREGVSGRRVLSGDTPGAALLAAVNAVEEGKGDE